MCIRDSLLLVLQKGDGSFVIAEQCRPSTVMSLRVDDLVGSTMDPEFTGELTEAMRSESIYHSSILRTIIAAGTAPVSACHIVTVT